jgi:hypothetical protein
MLSHCSRPKNRDVLLGVLLATQLIALLYITSRPSVPREPTKLPDVGDTIRSVSARVQFRDTVLRFESSNTTHLLISVRSTCAWCTEAMPLIREQLPRLRSKMQVTLVTAEADTAASRYLRQHGVFAEVLSMAEETSGALGRALTARTPWFFLIDHQGIVQRSSHTADLESVDLDSHE